jgi:polysaccharide biosynthesis transport protein
MELQPRRDNSDELRSFEPIELPRPRNYQTVGRFLLEDEHPILHYYRILRKRRWAILATLAIVFVLSVIGTMRTTRLYQATSKIAIFPEEPNILGFKDLENGASMDPEYEAALETQVAILRSDALAMKTIAAMHLDQDPRFTGVGRASPAPQGVIPESTAESDPAKAVGLLGTFHGGLGVQMIPSTRLIQITYTHPDRQLAAEIANGLVKTFIEENFRTKYESVTQTSEWLSRELADLQLKVETSEEKLVRYQKEHGILGVDEKQNIVTAKLGELNKELTEAQTDRIEKEAAYRLGMAGDPSTFGKPSRNEPSGLMDRLLEKEADLNTQQAQLATQFGPGYPKVVELNNQIKQVHTEIEKQRTRMQERGRDEYLAAVQRETLLTSALDQQKQEANRLNESAITYSVLQRDAESNRQLYQNLLERLKEAGVSAGLRSSNIRVVDVARTPASPIQPNVPQNLKLGFLLGLAGGIGLAFLLESLDRTVRNAEEVSAVSMLPALAVIPLQLASNSGNMVKQLKTVPDEDEPPKLTTLIAHDRPKSEAAEAYRALRTSILLSSFGAPPKVILVTSPLPQEGKTTISANSALVLAQRGNRVLLLDADLRRPGIERLFGLPRHRGLSTLISGVDKVEDVMVSLDQIPNLWVLPAGPIPPQPAELLSSDVMKGYLARWRDEFDHVIIDTPPCLSVTDAVMLSPEADRVIMVARSGQTTKVALRRACDLLLHVNAKVMGIVLNAFNVHSGEGYHYLYGGRYAGYYYEEASPKNGASAASKVS